VPLGAQFAPGNARVIVFASLANRHLASVAIGVDVGEMPAIAAFAAAAFVIVSVDHDSLSRF
jgi:hypothetical protein